MFHSAADDSIWLILIPGNIEYLLRNTLRQYFKLDSKGIKAQFLLQDITNKEKYCIKFEIKKCVLAQIFDNVSFLDFLPLDSAFQCPS